MFLDRELNQSKIKEPHYWPDVKLFIVVFKENVGWLILIYFVIPENNKYINMTVKSLSYYKIGMQLIYEN